MSVKAKVSTDAQEATVAKGVPQRETWIANALFHEQYFVKREIGTDTHSSRMSVTDRRTAENHPQSFPGVAAILNADPTFPFQGYEWKMNRGINN